MPVFGLGRLLDGCVQVSEVRCCDRTDGVGGDGMGWDGGYGGRRC